MEGQPENGKSRFQAALLVGMMKRFWVEMFANCLRQPEIQNGTATALRQTVEQNEGNVSIQPKYWQAARTPFSGCLFGITEAA